MTVIMTTPHDGEHFDSEVVHEAKIPSTKETVGITHCGLMFDLPEYILRQQTQVVGDIHIERREGRLVTALEAGVPPTCLKCIARDM